MTETNIHPTAIIDPQARLGAGVQVGPYAVIGAGVELGDGSSVGHHATLEGPSKIGPRNEFFPYAAIGFKTQDLKYKGEPTFLEIGEGNVFREFCTVHRGTGPGEKTVIGNGNLIRTSRIIASSGTARFFPTMGRWRGTSRWATTPSSAA